MSVKLFFAAKFDDDLESRMKDFILKNVTEVLSLTHNISKGCNYIILVYN